MELKGKRVAVFAENNYEDLELWYPVLRLREAGADITIVGTGAQSYTSKHGYPVQADAKADAVRCSNSVKSSTDLSDRLEPWIC
jgi:protease I